MWEFTIVQLLLLPILIPACGPIFNNKISPNGNGISNRNQFLPSVQLPRNCPSLDLQANKVLVTTFFQETIGNKNVENLERYLSQNYIQHNPSVADGIEGFREFIRNTFRNDPKVQIDFKRVSAEGDLVWLHSRVPIGTRNFAVIDIFRIECGKIAEHWDVLQEITPEILRNARNRQPFF